MKTAAALALVVGTAFLALLIVIAWGVTALIAQL
jgi:hypothetical protein